MTMYQPGELIKIPEYAEGEGKVKVWGMRTYKILEVEEIRPGLIDGDGVVVRLPHYELKIEDLKSGKEKIISTEDYGYDEIIRLRVKRVG